MKIIEADNLGVKFRLRREKSLSLRQSLGSLVRGRRAEYEDFWALRHVGLAVNEGETLGVIGRNGSGKSTLLRTIAKIFTPDEGRVVTRGTVSTLLSLSAGFQHELSGLENIYLNGIIMGFREREIDAVLSDIIEFSELAHFIDAPVKTYSSGMNARLGFSIAIHLQRDVMLVDEILGVGDEKFKEKSGTRMERLMREGRTIVLISHAMETIHKYSSQVIWLDNGALRAQGKPESVIEQYLAS